MPYLPSEMEDKENIKLTFVCFLLEDVFVLTKKDEKNPEIFGLFSTTR